MMMRFVEEADRGQWTLLPECLDDFIDESNPVRVIDVFVDALVARFVLWRKSAAAPLGTFATLLPTGDIARREHCYPIWSTSTGKLSALIWPFTSVQKQFT